MTASHLLGPIFSFKKNFANIVIKKGVTKNKAVAVPKGSTVSEIQKKLKPKKKSITQKKVNKGY